MQFVQKLCALRMKCSILRRIRFLTGRYGAELDIKDLKRIHAPACGNGMRSLMLFTRVL
jgi:hypothetical protein